MMRHARHIALRGKRKKGAGDDAMTRSEQELHVGTAK
jgi:hypothetical protein